jgi:iron complex outermembrane receptor protein
MKAAWKSLAAARTSLLALASPALAQQTPGDQTGTAQAAGAGQSAASATNAPASPRGTPAPTAAPAADASSADIIVTARRVEERLQDVPISITVFNQQQLNNRNVVNAQDLATYTPSLSANSNFGDVNSSFAIRGFVQDIGTQPSVGVYFADVVAPRGSSPNIPIGDGAGPGSFFDLQNVQVLKGPQGTLFGRNTTGGAVLLVPQKPTSKFEGYIEGSYGDYDLKRIQAVVNVPLGDRARFRIGVDHESRDGYLHNDTGVGPDRFNDINYYAVRASLVLDLTPDLENYTIASFLRSDTTGSLQKLIGCVPGVGLSMFACDQLANERAKGAGFYTVQNNPLQNPRTLLDQWQVINTTTWRATDDLTVKNIASYAQLTEFFRNPLFGTDFNLYRIAGETIAGLGLPASLNPYKPGTSIGFATIAPLAGYNSADQWTATEEFQLQGNSLAGRLTWQAGAYLEISQPLRRSGSQTPALLFCRNSAIFDCDNPIGAGSEGQSIAETFFHNVGLYTQGTYSVTDKLKLTGGIRYTWDRVRTDSQQYSYAVPVPEMPVFTKCGNPDASPPGCFLRYHERSHAPTWLIDVDYKPTDRILAYAKYARGYRAGGITPNSPTELATFRPEKVDSYEGGLKTSFLGAVRGTLNVAGFYNDFTNQQIQLGLDPKVLGQATPASTILNAGKSRIYGAEVEGSVTPFRGFTLDVSYAYLNTKVRSVTIPDFSSPLYVLDSPVRAGDKLTLSPANKVSATAAYVLPLDEAIGRVTLAATFTHTDRQVSNYADRNSSNPAIRGLGTLAARNLLNLNLNWNSIVGTPIDLALFATNVTNQHYYSFVPGLAQQVGIETAQIGEPRMYGARLRVRFGE